MSNIYKKAEVLIGEENYVCCSEGRVRDEANGADMYDGNDFSSATYTVDCNVQEKIIIRHARKTAREIIEEASECSNRMYKEGYIKGLEEGEKQYSAHLEKAKQVLEQTREEAKKMLECYEKQILELSLKIAEKIIYRKIEEDETVLNDMFLNAINKAIHENSDEIRIRMSAENISKMMSEKELERIKANFIPDKRMDSGACVIETENGTVDASIESRLDQLRVDFGLDDEGL